MGRRGSAALPCIGRADLPVRPNMNQDERSEVLAGLLWLSCVGCYVRARNSQTVPTTNPNPNPKT